MNTLKLRDRGEFVRQLQILLNARLVPSPDLRIDGDFGPGTEAAVRQFQTSKGLAPDGIVGQKTWSQLGSRPPTPVVSPVGSVGAPWMEIAAAELGVHENSLPGQHNQRILEYHKATSLRASTDETPWCSSFVNWVIVTAGYVGTNNALAASWLDWGRALDQPRAGAITVIKKKGASSDVATGSSTGFHVGFYVSGTGASFRLLGGNQGDQVKYSNYFLASYDVRGYRWPF